ncbi:MAG: hypothetical protein ACKOTZ_08455 [Chloroflexota bacterium]
MRPTRCAALLAAGIVAAMVAPLPAAAADPPPVLVAIDGASSTGTDRIVFTFAGGLPAAVSIRWLDGRPTDDASGLPSAVSGNAFLTLVFRGAAGHGARAPYDRTYGRPSRALDLRNVADVTELGDWEGVLSFAIGVMARTEDVTLGLRTQPPRVVVTIGNGYPAVRLPVYLVDRGRLASGPPWLTPAWRTVPDDGFVARSLLRRLFAGPTDAERDLGLRFYPSGAWSFADLRVTPGGIARVRMVGECARGIAPPSLAQELTRTLRSLAAVDVVKVYDPAGTTRVPAGPVDSIPPCLELPVG